MLNLDIERLLQQPAHTSFVPLNDLPRHMHSRHGLHFNRRGKRLIAAMMKENYTLQHTLTSDKDIDVVEANMNLVFITISKTTLQLPSHTPSHLISQIKCK